MSSKCLRLFPVVFLLAGCSGDRESDSRRGLSAESLPGVYAGVFPCEDCPGLPTTLWLHPEGRFIIEQVYPATADRAAMTAHSLGRWRWSADGDELILRGEGPTRRFERLHRDALSMQTDTGLEHHLNRDPGAPDFTGTIRMSGMVSMQGGSAWFTECLAGFTAPVAKGGDSARFWHQYRSTGTRGRPTYVDLEGRFSWSEAGSLQSLTMERFITVKADGACPPA